MKIANIVTNNKVDVSDDINVVKSLDEIIEGLPTLVTSYTWLKDNYDDYDIYDKQLGENLWWTFAKTERRDTFNRDIETFITLANKKLIERVDYVFLDLIQYHDTTVSKIVRKIFSLPNKVAFKHKDMIYIYGGELIFGIDLYLLNYMGFDEISVEKKIKSICADFLEDDEIFIEYKDNMERLNHSVKYIPYLYAIKNE
jgi:hypothetical protein